MKLIVLDQAKLEINEHVAWYRDRDPEAAERLSFLFEEAVHEIVKNPARFSLMEMRRNPGNIRRVILKNFPIYIPYQIFDDEVYILAVAHASRRPGYWRKRIRK